MIISRPFPIIAGSIGKYAEYTRISFQKMLAYRVSYLIGIVTYMIHVAVYYYLYRALYTDATSINGYNLDEMLTYISLGWISKSFYLNYIDREITDDVKSGQLAMDLIKPVDFQLMYISRGLGQSLFRMVMFTPPIVIMTFTLFSVAPPPSVVHLTVFLICTIGSVVIYLCINYLIGMSAIYFLSISGILYSKNLIIELFSGLLVPIDWFPAWFRHLSAALPFQAIAYYPLQIYLGRLNGSELIRPLAIQLFWIVILALLGRMMWTICQRRVLIQGG